MRGANPHRSFLKASTPPVSQAGTCSPARSSASWAASRSTLGGLPGRCSRRLVEWILLLGPRPSGLSRQPACLLSLGPELPSCCLKALARVCFPSRARRMAKASHRASEGARAPSCVGQHCGMQVSVRAGSSRLLRAYPRAPRGHVKRRLHLQQPKPHCSHTLAALQRSTGIFRSSRTSGRSSGPRCMA